MEIPFIINHFTDNDLYTFTCQYYILQQYPRAEVRYKFFDRNDTRYPQGFTEMLQKQIDHMKDVVITEEEISFMRKRIYFLPEWYYNFLRGYRFNPNEVHITQDEQGHLSILIEGKWFSTIMWEMPILSTVSELMHHINGDLDRYNEEHEAEKAAIKCRKAILNGLALSDFGTRRRFSFRHQENILRAMSKVQNKEKHLDTSGAFVGTSNVWFAKEFNLNTIGTMSHQIVSFEECVSGLFECNYNVMDKWSRVYDGDVGIYLYDTFSDKIFLNNFSKRLAKTFDGLRVDSGDEKEQTLKIIKKYESLGIDPATKSIVYSNALDIDKAIKIHQWLNGRMKDAYGIGTYLCADVTVCDKNGKPTEKRYPYSNIVIKLTGMRITENREWQECVKISNDVGKMLGDYEKCHYLIGQIEKSEKSSKTSVNG